MRTLRTRLALTFLAFIILSCAPTTSTTVGSNTHNMCSSRVGPWYDCKTRCLPAEQLTMQCSSKLGIVFATRPGLTTETKYGWGQQSDFGCGMPVARIWRLRKIPLPSPAELGYLSPPSQTQPDCATTPTRTLAPEADRVYYLGEDVSSEYGAYLDSMSTAITPASPTQIVQTFNAPADGDIANAASVNVAFQSLENSVEALRFLTYGGGFYPRVKATSNTVMTIQPLGAVIVKQLGVWTAVPHSVATTIDPLALAGGAFAANTRYYVYVNLVAGVITWSVSTTAPDAGYRYKTGDEQYQFVTTFYADTGPNLIPYTQSGKTYLTKKFSAATVQLSGGNAVVPTAVSFSAYIPTNATSVLLQVVFIPNADQASAYLYSFDLTSITMWGDAASGTNNIYGQVEASTLDGGFGYVVSNALDQLNVYALGFTL
jgi:hypothetical protein